jgi:hypothetical protein
MWTRMARSGREERSVVPFSSGWEVEELIFRVIRSLQSYLSARETITSRNRRGRGSAVSISNGREVIKFSFSLASKLNL